MIALFTGGKADQDVKITKGTTTAGISVNTIFDELHTAAWLLLLPVFINAAKYTSLMLPILTEFVLLALFDIGSWIEQDASFKGKLTDWGSGTDYFIMFCHHQMGKIVGNLMRQIKKRMKPQGSQWVEWNSTNDKILEDSLES
ncbi:hypothetical protein Tco_1136765 [Tanacetum coccineum]